MLEINYRWNNTEMEILQRYCHEGTVIIVRACKLSREWVRNHENGFVLLKNFVILLVSTICTHFLLTCLNYFSVAVKKHH